MIPRGYCVMMARYNPLRNSQLQTCLQALPEVAAWRSGIGRRDGSGPIGRAALHVFNRRTRRRGPVHATFTAACATAPAGGLAFMPEEF